MDFQQFLNDILHPTAPVAISIFSLLVAVSTFVVNVRFRHRAERFELAAGVSLWRERNAVVFEVGSGYPIYNVALYGKAGAGDFRWIPLTYTNHQDHSLMWVPSYAKFQEKNKNDKILARFDQVPPGMWKADFKEGGVRHKNPTVLRMDFLDGRGRSWSLQGGRLHRKFFHSKSAKRFAADFAGVIRRTDKGLLRTGQN